MFSLFKTKSSSSTYFPITTDMHSHILPGIDDGAPDVEASVELVKGLMELGVTHSIATPHVISDMYRNTPETIGKALAELRSALEERGINYKVDAAAEYMMDAAFFEMIKNNEPLLTIKDNIILTEFSFGSIPDNPKQMSFNIITAGYNPILAHPERYAYFHNNYKAYHFLKELGFMLQVNLLSLGGHYGPGVEKAAKYIIKNGLATFVGTDMHHVRHLEGLKNGRAVFEKWLGDREWEL